MNNQPQPKRHSFSRTLARKTSPIAALLLARLDHKLKHTQHRKHGKPWYYATLDEWAAHYPYLSRTAIAEAFRKIPGDILTTGSFNKRKYDRTRWYTFTTPEQRRAAKANLVYFRVEDAVELGLASAVLLENLRSWLKDGQSKAVSPQELSRLLPFSKSTLQRCLGKLVERGHLTREQRKYRLGAGPSKAHDYTHLKRGSEPGSARPGPESRDPRKSPIFGGSGQKSAPRAGQKTGLRAGGPLDS